MARKKGAFLAVLGKPTKDRKWRTDLGIESINDLLAHIDVILRSTMICNCELCQRWERVCAAALDLYDGPVLPAESRNIQRSRMYDLR